MYFQVLDSKMQCHSVFCDGQLHQNFSSLNLSRTWAPTPHFSDSNIDYAHVLCEGKDIGDVCPDHLKEDWLAAVSKAQAFLNTFEVAKVNLGDICFYDSVPEHFLVQFYGLKNQITQHVFENHDKPKNYEFMTALYNFTKQIEQHYLNIDMSRLDYTNKIVRAASDKLKKANNKISYNPWGTVTGRLTTNPNSFPILTLNKELRPALLPKNDLFVELDFNSAEVRTMLALLGEDQPEQDLHEWICTNIFDQKLNREQTKKKVFRWLYNPKAKNKKLSARFDRDQLVQKHYTDGHVATPFKRTIKASEDKALNYLIQSTSSDVFLRSLLKVHSYLNEKKSFICFCIHDSLVIDFAKEEKDMLSEIIAIFADTPYGQYKTNVSVGRNFGSMRKIS